MNEMYASNRSFTAGKKITQNNEILQNIEDGKVLETKKKTMH